jgi:hypothetical protein
VLDHVTLIYRFSFLPRSSPFHLPTLHIDISRPFDLQAHSMTESSP